MGSHPRVLVVGAGFGGLNVTRGLARAAVRVTLVDRTNHHLFQPLLYQVATATLSPAQIATPVRSVLRRQKNAEVLLAEITGIDRAAREAVAGDRRLGFDYLVLATGAQHFYFGHEGWAEHAPGLKTIPDATQIRQKILSAFERAEMETDPARREALLHFVLVGGGPTGVEMAGAISELAHRALSRDFRRINPRSARITVVEAGPRCLGTFPETLSRRAERDLAELGVSVMTGAKVDRIDPSGVWIGERCLRAETVIWTAGVAASGAARWLGAETDRAGRARVGPDLSLPGDPRIFVIGDTATVSGIDGRPLPGTAPVAMQQGRYVAGVISRELEGAAARVPFRYRDKGNLATIGRRRAVADLGRVRLAGPLAWYAWVFVHIFYLIGFHNRILVMIEWAWAYLTFHRGARLILPRRE